MYLFCSQALTILYMGTEFYIDGYFPSALWNYYFIIFYLYYCGQEICGFFRNISLFSLVVFVVYSLYQGSPLVTSLCLYFPLNP